jgi:glycine betaine/proline transport system substrate-binding protein
MLSSHPVIRRRLLTLIMAAVLPMTATAAQAVRFSVPPWPGIQVKTEVAKQILQALGYQTRGASLAPYFARLGPVSNIKALSSGEADIFLGVWMPIYKATLDAALKKGRIAVAGVNLKAARYGIVVPDYVWNAGVHSMADLHQYPDRFGKKIYGIEAGSSSNRVIKKAIKNNIYNLLGWQLVASRTAAMLAQAEHSTSRHEWVAFLGWKPHWMNVEFNLKYLKDPENILGYNARVLTIANKQFLKDNPNIARFLHQFRVKSQTQARWIYQKRYKKANKTVVARHWITQHKRAVNHWLQGVKAVNGRAAAKTVNRAFGGPSRE